MSDEHKAALAKGREQGRAVRNYLEALASNRPKRGRKRTEESVKTRLAKIDVDLRTADPLQKLQLVQEQLDLQTELGQMQNEAGGPDMSELEGQFIKYAGAYAEAKGITYGAFRQVGVDPGPLKLAGIRPRVK